MGKRRQGKGKRVKKFGHEQRKTLPCPKSSGYNFVATQKEQPPMSKTILIQDHLRRALPKVLVCRDYREQEQLLVRADRILRVSGVERLFVSLSLERYQAAAAV